MLDVKCWGDQKSVVVKVIDICPCWYEPKGMAPYFQYGCCYKQQQHPKAGQLNLDLSFWVSGVGCCARAFQCNDACTAACVGWYFIIH